MSIKIVLFGPPGVGKDTQGSTLSSSLGVPFISTSILFRQKAKEKTPQGRILDKFLTSGRLVPDTLVIDLMNEHLSDPSHRHGYIMEGFPRTVRQAKALETMAVTDLAIHLKASRKALLYRVGGRLTCHTCDAVYHLNSAPPRKRNTCDLCGGKLYQRTDHDPKIHDERLQDYETHTLPLAVFYGEKRLLAEVNGEGTIGEVQERILNTIADHRPLGKLVDR